MTYPEAIPQDASNTLLRRILYALRNNGQAGLAPMNSDNILLRQILFAVQNQTGGGSGHFDNQGNVQVYDSVNDVWRTLTAPDGVLTVA